MEARILRVAVACAAAVSVANAGVHATGAAAVDISPASGRQETSEIDQPVELAVQPPSVVAPAALAVKTATAPSPLIPLTLEFLPATAEASDPGGSPESGVVAMPESLRESLEPATEAAVASATEEIRPDADWQSQLREELHVAAGSSVQRVPEGEDHHYRITPDPEGAGPTEGASTDGEGSLQAAAAGQDFLSVGQRLNPGESISSGAPGPGRSVLWVRTIGNTTIFEIVENPTSDGSYGVIHQVLYGAVANAYVVLESNGNLVMYAPDGRVLDDSGTGGLGGVQLRLTTRYATEGNAFPFLRLYNNSGGIVYDFDTHFGYLFGELAGLGSGGQLVSYDRSTRLRMQADGNVVLTEYGVRTWSTGTEGNSGSFVFLYPDGSLRVVSNDLTRVLYTTGPHVGSNRSIVASSGDLIMNATVDGFPFQLVVWTAKYGSIPIERTYGRGCDPCAWNWSASWGYPVNTASGAETLRVRDVGLAGAGVPFEMTRSYTSADPTAGPLGPGWTHGLNSALLFPAAGVVVYRGPEGQQSRFVEGPGSTLDPDPGVLGVLTVVSGGWRLTNPDGQYVTFDSAGRLTATRDRTGTGLALTYSGGRLVRVTDAAGRQVTMTNNSSGLVTRVTLPDGRFVNYSYTSGLLTAVRDLRGQTTTYAYDVDGRLRLMRDPLGNEVRTAYDSATGRVTSQTDPRGLVTTFAWDAATGRTTITRPDGGVWVEDYDGNVLVSRTDALGQVTDYIYDENVNLVGVRDELRRVTSMSFDAHGNMLTRTHPKVAGEAGGYTESWTYNATNDVTSHTDRRGSRTTYEYNGAALMIRAVDPNGGGTSYMYNLAGQVTSVTDPRGNTTTSEYNTAGGVAATVSPRGARTTFEYDSSGRLLRTVNPLGNVAGGIPADHTTTFAYDDGGLVTSGTDAAGGVTLHAYDLSGRRTSTTDPVGRVTTFAYDAAGNRTSITDATGAVWSTAYDPVGRVTEERSPAGRATFTYDDVGNVLTETSPRGNATGATPGSFTTRHRHDPVGNIVSTTDPAGQVTTHAYDAMNRRTVFTDARGNATTTTYDANDNITSVTDGEGGITRTAYDILDRAVTVSDPRNPLWVTQFQYLPTGQVSRKTTPDGARWTWDYDADGNRTREVDPRGTVAGANPDRYASVTVYDLDGRATSVTDPLGNTTAQAYDAIGRMTSSTDPRGGVTTHTYRADGALASVTGPANTGTTAYGYDAAGNLTTRTDTKGRVTRYAYDAARRLTSTTLPDGRIWASRYDPNGNRTVVETPIGTATTANPDDGLITSTFDSRDQVTALNYSDSTPDVTYTYDAVGHRIRMSDGAGVATYTYDRADRLASLTRDGDTTTYTYDAAGNITRRAYPDATTMDAAYDATGRQISISRNGVRHATYTYDPAGRPLTAALATGVAHEWSYDRAGRPLGVTSRTGLTLVTAVNAVLDPTGNPTRITTTTPGVGTPPAAAPGSSPLQVVVGDPSLLPLMTALAAATSNDQGEALLQVVDTRSGAMTIPGCPTTPAAPRDQTAAVDSLAGLPYASRGGELTGPLSPECRPSAVTTTRRADPSGSALAVRGDSYVYDLAGRVTRHCLGLAAGASCDAAAGASLAYAYDEVGNRTGVTRTGVPGAAQTTYSFDAADRMTQVTSGGTSRPVTTDVLGNITNDGAGRTYSSDLGSHLKTVATGNITLSYGYDGDGTRLTQTATPTGGGASTATRLVWDPTFDVTQPVAQRGSAAGSWQRSWVHGPAGTGPVSISTAAAGGGATTGWVHPGWMTTPAGVSNAAGQVTATTDYDLFGVGSWSTADGAVLPSWTTTSGSSSGGTSTLAVAGVLGPFGELSDPATRTSASAALVGLRARTMDPTTGRFLSPDPLTPVITDPYVTAYAYANNRPGVLNDPTGQCALLCTAAIGAGIGAVIGGASYAITNRSNFSWGGLGGAVATGAITGAIAGAGGYLIGGAAAGVAARYGIGGLAAGIGSHAIGGAGAGFLSTTVSAGIQGRTPTRNELVFNTGIGAVTGGLGAAAAYRQLFNPKCTQLWRGDTRGPKEIFSQGFQARGGVEDLYQHAAYQQPSNWVSTSVSRGIAKDYANPKGHTEGWVYEIVAPPGGLSVNRELFRRSPYVHESEIVFREIDPSYIRSAHRVQNTQWKGVPERRPGSGPR